MMIQSKTNNHLSLIIWLGVLYNCRDTSTTIESSLQIKLFMQNKANFRKSQMNVNKVLTKNYEILDTWWSGKTKPIQSQLKPIKCQNKPNTKPNKPNFRGKNMLLIFTTLKVLENSIIASYHLDQPGSLNHMRLS